MAAAVLAAAALVAAVTETVASVPAVEGLAAVATEQADSEAEAKVVTVVVMAVPEAWCIGCLAYA